ncbi:hypothetical protein [Lysobacter fragariae]
MDPSQEVVENDMETVSDAFNEAHPPFVASVDQMPPPRTQAGVMGSSTIGKDNFDNVRDPAYLWQDMPEVTPTERKRRDDTRKAKLEQVEGYHLRRERYWELVRRMQFAEDVEYEVTLTRGIETTHQVTESKTSTENIGLTLGLQLSGDLFKPGAAKKAAAFRDASRAANVEAETSLEFTYQLTNELRFERVDSQTYREETSLTTRTTYRGGNVYYVWQLSEALVMSRKRPGKELVEPMNDMVASTGVNWTDRYTYAPNDQGEDE